MRFRIRISTRFLSVLILLVALGNPGKAKAQSFISPQFSFSLQSGNYGAPVGLAFTQDGSRMFVWEKAGIVHVSNWNNVTKNYDLQATPVLNISEEVGNWGDFGLLGFALDPNFDVNGYIYLMYEVDRHYLLNFGTANYNANTNEYFNATIGRITRYTTSINGSQETIADPSSRLILLGETKTTGIPILHDSHGVGTLMFAPDGTLLASTGDGASYDGVDSGSNIGSFFNTALADGIIRATENVGAFRAQMVNSYSGKVLRLDPATGNGVSSNPYYDAGNPRSAKSRVWAMGLRNPFRFILKPNTGSPNPATGDLGEIYIGDVGWNKWEELNIIRNPGVNCGWPIYEGFTETELYPTNILNKEEPNPLFGTGGCTQQFFKFNDLLKQPTADDNRFLPNPCNNSVSVVTGNSNRFIHQRPTMAWIHASYITGTTYVGIFTGNNADVASIGTPASNVTGTPFYGNCAAGACWYTGNKYGVKYDGTYFLADFGGQFIKNITVPTTDQISVVEDFASGAGQVICMMQSPMDSLIYMVDYTNNTIKRLNFGGNKQPIAVLNSTTPFGPSPLSVSFSSNGSNDPENGTLTYNWNFGDGNTSTAANPTHIFGNSGNSTPNSFTVTLTVTDNLGASSSVSKVISINNTPPAVSITSPLNNTMYSPGPNYVYSLTANVTDDQSDGLLKYAWQTVLRHNTHEHREPIDTNRNSSVSLAGVGCTGDTYYYFIVLSVTDPYGMVSSDSVKIFPSCVGWPPVVIASQPRSQAVCENTPVTFTSTSNDVPFPSIQWQKSIDNGNTWTDVPGAKNSNLQVIAASVQNGAQYRASWTNSAGPIYSNTAILTVSTPPSAPSGIGTQGFCNTATVADLVATGSNIKWYASASGGTPLLSTESLQSGQHYFASQTSGGCESIARLDVLVNVSSNSTATLDGSASTGTISSYAWTNISGPNAATITNPSAATTSVTGLIPGTYVFQLSLNSGASTSLVSIKVNNPGAPTVADAGFDRTIALPVNSFQLDGSGSTGSIVSFAWSQLSGPNTASIGAASQVSTAASGLVQGSYQFELKVTDTNSLVKKDTVQITVNAASPGNTSPTIVAINTKASTTSSTTNNLTSVPANALLVLTIAQPDDIALPNPVVTSSPSLVWTKQADAQAVNSGNAEIYTAVFAAGGNINITTTWGGNGLSTVAYVITGYNASFAGVNAIANSQATPSVSLTTVQANSLLLGVTSDWSAQNAARTYRDGATESFYDTRVNIYTGYHYRKVASSIGTYTEGLTAPNGMSAGTAFLEIKGNTDIAPLANAGANFSINIPGPPTGASSQQFCLGATVSDLVASGSAIKWYAAASGGSPIASTDSLVNGNHYYASQTVSGCEVSERLDVTSTVITVPTPIITAVDNCDSTFTLATVAAGSLLWSTGASTPSIIADTAGTYTVISTQSGCNSKAGSLAVTPVLLVLTATSTQPLCIGGTGSVVLNATGGAGGYVFGSTATTNLAEGIYDYSVTDGNGCTKHVQVEIAVKKAIWTGSIDTDWHKPGNWSTGVIPDSTTHVIIPVTTNDCIISNADAEAASVQTRAGAIYRIENNRKIMIHGNCSILPALD